MGHPDKVADQISDTVLDALISRDPNARVACETLVTTGLVVVAGEVTVHNKEAELALSGIEADIRQTIADIGYTDPGCQFDHKSCAVIRTIHSQSADISQGVTAGKKKRQGAGDQGLMFGFACRETKVLMPLPIHLSHRLVEKLAEVRMDGTIPWLRPDSKSQVTIEYDGSKPVKLKTIVISTQHQERPELLDRQGNVNDKFRKTIIEKVIKPVCLAECPELWSNDITFHINPTGRFVIGGPHGDSGLTGRKIIVDSYGGRGAHGGGAFSGKDPSKVDRSATYMARHVAKNVVASGLADICQVQLAYAIGVADPVSVLIDTECTNRIPEERIEALVRENFDLTPGGIIKYLNLKRPIYRETAAHGHFGRTGPGFTWEKTNMAEKLRKAGSRWMK
ncbi:MAG: methionine adenosyltransferase [Planctomycetia bacterium]|jgi:S-adenosylmethionine synthetase|nr:methionine adenosyltransferase [Planctomycetia bacterium]MCC7316352.1 methionine adenosyltransferase [Planctomycetota bacterium]OQZ05556.1 MAG: methionine adenosyltransferase [Planctomycetes bacterium UTPLA1]